MRHGRLATCLGLVMDRGPRPFSPSVPGRRAAGRNRVRGAAVLALALLVAGALVGAPAACADPTYDNLVAKAHGLIVEAERWYRTGDPARGQDKALEALRLLESASALEPGDSQAAKFAVQACALLRDAERAKSWLGRYEAGTPYGERDPYLHYLRALVAALVEGQPQKALRNLDRMYSVNPRVGVEERDNLYFQAHLAYGGQLAKAARYEDAIHQFATAAMVARRGGKTRRVLEARGNVGVVYQMADRWIEAADVFTALIREDAENPVWHWQLGLALANQAKWEKALPPYRETIRLIEAGKGDPATVGLVQEVYLRLGNCLKNLAGSSPDEATKASRLAEAERNIRRFIELKPANALGYKWLGMLYKEELDKPYEALPHLAKAYELDPVCDDALRAMIQIYSVLDPPPSADPADREKDLAAWRARREALVKDNEDNKVAREAEREKRRDDAGSSDNGCN
jgi:tetratricopeptide (TPR) repeat protein